MEGVRPQLINRDNIQAEDVFLLKKSSSLVTESLLMIWLSLSKLC